MAEYRVLRAVGRESQPWKNGGGSTSDVVVMPDGSTITSFDWRVSIATIDADSKFSHYPGVFRALVPLTDRGLTLRTPTGDHHVNQFEIITFAGEDPVETVGATEASRDLNLMVRRDAGVGTIIVQRLVGRGSYSAGDGALLVVVLEGTVAVTDGTTIGVDDALLVSTDVSIDLVGDAHLAVIRVTPERR
jgi:environmental stress-induced protein Ves